MNRRQFTSGLILSIPAGLGANLATIAEETPTAGFESLPPSGGLGLRGNEFIAKWGEPDNTTRIEGSYYNESWYTISGINLDEQRRIASIVIVPDSRVQYDSLSAYVCGERYSPKDAVETTRYQHPNGEGLVVVYNSEWLAERFSDKKRTWRETPKAGKIGDMCIMLWPDSQGALERMFVSTGRDPYNNYDDF